MDSHVVGSRFLHLQLLLTQSIFLSKLQCQLQSNIPPAQNSMHPRRHVIPHFRQAQYFLSMESAVMLPPPPPPCHHQWRPCAGRVKDIILLLTNAGYLPTWFICCPFNQPVHIIQCTQSFICGFCASELLQHEQPGTSHGFPFCDCVCCTGR